MTNPRPPFFTWTEEQFTEPAQVSDRMRRELKLLWLKGATVAELAGLFQMPAEWVEDFVHAEQNIYKPYKGVYS
jgi:hypothetical protein